MPDGFFNNKALPVAHYIGKEAEVKIQTCSVCKCYSECASPKVPYIGEGRKRILVIDGPINRVEETTGNQTHGQHYSRLREALKLEGIDLQTDCWYTHALKCYSPRKRYPPSATSACHGMLMAEVKLLNPDKIILCDPMVWEVLLYDRLYGRAADAPYMAWCGEIIPDQALKKWIFPIYSPSFVAKWDEKNFNPYALFWKQQIHAAITHNEPFPVIDPAPQVKQCLALPEAMAAIDMAMEWKLFAFDYETTGIKPHRKGHRILYASMSNGDISYSFPFFIQKEFRDHWKALLTNQARKIAHNANFERAWTEHLLGYEVNSLVHDPMLLQHCYRNHKPTGLKFLTYARYGILGYDAEIDKYIKPDKDEHMKYRSNAINNLSKAPASMVTRYNALDSLFTAWLFSDIISSLDPQHQLPGYKFFMEASIPMYHAYQNGARIDLDLLYKTEQVLEDRLKPLARTIMYDPIVIQKWDKSHIFNPRSEDDVRHLLFHILKLTPTAFTETNLPCVDAEAILALKDKCSFIEPLAEYRRWHKALSTYIGQIKSEQFDGILRSIFGFNGVKTYRSSSRNINYQNQPKRDKEVMCVIRSIYRPRPRHRIKEYDFKGAEVSAAAAITGDKNLIRYVSDPSTDMHRDLAMRMFMLPQEKVTKALRGQATKGPWTFAQFYGSYWKQCAAGIWSEIDIPNAVKVYGFDVVQHLKDNGIKTYPDWEKHCEEQEQVLWGEFFPGYQQWRQKTYYDFCKKGYVDYLNGFRYYGPATKNEVLNAPVQGPAFHIQIWACTQIDRQMHERKMDSQLIGQIHDSMVMDVLPAEEEYLDHLVWDYATQKVREHWPWITVPLQVEQERSAIDGTWAEMEGMGFLKGE